MVFTGDNTRLPGNPFPGRDRDRVALVAQRGAGQPGKDVLPPEICLWEVERPEQATAGHPRR